MKRETANGRFQTENGLKYVLQLCKHWSHKPGTVIDEDAKSIDFPNGFGVTFDVAPDVLNINAYVEADGDLDRWKGVVEDHLKRFAFREPHDVEWDDAST